METQAIQQYEVEGAEVVEHAKSIMIVDDTTREIAAEFTSKARKMVKAIDVEFKPNIEKAHVLHKELLAQKNKLAAPFKQAQVIVDAEIKRDYFEQEKERRRLEREAQIKADAEKTRQEQEQQADAEELIEAGDIEEAEAVLDADVVTAPVVPVAPSQKTTRTAAGTVSMRKDIKVTVLDPMVVVKAVATGQLPITLIKVDEGAAKRYAKASGLKAMPGFRVEETASVSGRV